MRKLIVLVVVAVAAWYGWKHWAELREAPRDEVVIENGSGRGLVRVRLKIGDQTFVRESIPEGEPAVFPFRVAGDATFALKWQFAREEVDRSWSGGQVTSGPLRMRHTLHVTQDGGVVWTSASSAGAKPRVRRRRRRARAARWRRRRGSDA